MASSDIVSPSGLDLSPKPPSSVRVSKRAGILFLTVGAMIAGMILYGIATRGDRQFKLGLRAEESAGMTAATDAGRVVASKIPTRPTSQIRQPGQTDELSTDPVPQRALSGNARTSAKSAHAQTVQSVTAPLPGQYRDLTPEERRRELAYQREMEALEAPTASRGGFSGSSEARAVDPGLQGDTGQLMQLLQAIRSSPAATSNANGPLAVASRLPRIALAGGSQSQAEEYKLQNAQDEKEAFLNKARSHEVETYLGATRVKPLGKYEIKAGWDIPAILEQALNSDLPGEIRALVRESVYDTATGKYLLIPQGSRLVGFYDSRIAYGQDGVQVAWNRIIFPDASSINLEGMAGQDARGYSGLRHDVDNHYRRLIGTAVLTSVFSAAFQLSQTRRGTVFTYPSAGEIAGSSAAGNLSQIGGEVTRRNLNVQPTIKVPIGYRFNVRVNQDLLFDASYKPLEP
jgi:type IV secretion system protein VirB10